MTYKDFRNKHLIVVKIKILFRFEEFFSWIKNLFRVSEDSQLIGVKLKRVHCTYYLKAYTFECIPKFSQFLMDTHIQTQNMQQTLLAFFAICQLSESKIFFQLLHKP